MAEEQEYTITIRVEIEEDEPEYDPSLADIAIYSFTNTLNQMVGFFVLAFFVGLIMSLFE
jgi:hypothetical protein